jgi:uncharacterized RDD family membrane protein YckC
MTENPPPPPENPYGSQPPPSSDPYAGNPPAAGQTPYGSTPPPPPPPPPGQNPYGAEAYPTSAQPPPVAGAQPAGLGSRFLARLIDGIMLAVLQGIISLATGRVVAGIIGGIIYLGYYAYMESSQGRTLAKQWLKMRVHGASGGNPTMEEALRRNAWAALGILSTIPLLGILTGLAELVAIIAIAVTINSDPLKRGWHDKFANTSVTKEG